MEKMVEVFGKKLKMDQQISEVISQQDAKDFLREIKNTFKHMTQDQLRYVQLYDYRRKAIVPGYRADHINILVN
jgi:endoglucanase Acf2